MSKYGTFFPILPIGDCFDYIYNIFKDELRLKIFILFDNLKGHGTNFTWENIYNIHRNKHCKIVA